MSCSLFSSLVFCARTRMHVFTAHRQIHHANLYLAATPRSNELPPPRLTLVAAMLSGRRY
ncbi:unnamed protein product [Callosobruchus maculatus]|uniref:Uncharacterized protein n=2 Tax=Callosobruchus maculatus TaxID=64391 RepID=A0A653BT88_CALMS|nr:unnamed protein product [Callosobruchus maculatus]